MVPFNYASTVIPFIIPPPFEAKILDTLFISKMKSKSFFDSAKMQPPDYVVDISLKVLLNTFIVRYVA